MKKLKVTAAAAIAVSALAIAASDASAWCWKRENGLVSCGLGYTAECCEGALEKWVSEEAEVTSAYRISASTDPARVPDIVAGFSKWNEIEMSTFRFARGDDTSVWYDGRDGINVINVDASFCTHYPEYCGVGILGFSAAFTRGIEATYKAVEADIVMNGEEFDWGPEGSTGDVIDTVAVVAHEAGHNAGLSHAGYLCRSAGSSGCGQEVEAATMYWSYSGGQPTSKASLELDDVAAMVAGYPRSTVRVKVVDATSEHNPVAGVTVTVNGTAFPISLGEGATDPGDYDVNVNGGYVIGDLTSAATLVGDRAASSSYLSLAPHFSDTDASGLTEYRVPVTRTFSIKAQKGMAAFVLDDVTLNDGENTVEIQLDLGLGEDFGAPSLTIDSHVDGQIVNASSIVLSGTASDAGTGDNGISAVYVGGLRALGDVAAQAATAEWTANVTLEEGPNRIEVIALDNSSTPDWNVMTKTIMVVSDTTAPEVVSTNPEVGVVDPDLNPVVKIGFSEALDPDTVNGTNVTLTADAATLGGTVSYDPDARVVEFAPTAGLEFEKTYTLTVKSAVTDLAGNGLASDYSFTVSTLARTGSGGGGGSTGNHTGGTPDAGKEGGCFIDTLMGVFR